MCCRPALQPGPLRNSTQPPLVPSLRPASQLPGSSGIGAGSIGYDDDATFRAALGEAVRRAAAGSLGAPDPPLSEDAEALPV